VAACGSSAAATSSTAAQPLDGSLTVLAAASLTDAFTSGGRTLQQQHQGLVITFSFAGSQQLVTAVENGAPGDVIATADTATMQTLVTGGLVDAPVSFARNRLVIAVAHGNPRGIAGLRDLSRGDLTVVLADPSVPAGRYAHQALAAAGVSVTPRSLELSVRSALAKVQSGDADASIVYVTEVGSTAGAVDGVAIPDAQNIVATYPIAVVRGTTHHAAAAALVDDVVRGTLHAALLARGFLAP
jgi:molybdate transport system substrate-binding protein